MISNRTKLIILSLLTFSLILSGCSLTSGEKKKIDPPQDVSYLKEDESTTITEEEDKALQADNQSEKEAAVMTELFLIDKNDFVASKTMMLPNTESVAKQALQYLVSEGPVESMLPNGFRAVLPPDTMIHGVNIEDGKAIADFSSEFKNYQAEDEEKIVQAVTWTLTQFDGVDSVEMRMNGETLTEMPVNGTVLASTGLTRNQGINIETEAVADITNTHPVIVYFIAQNDDDYYYVPVTKRASNTETDRVTAAVNQLIAGPGYESELVSGFLPDVKLLETPKLENGQVTLNFNDAVLGSYEKKMISNHLLQSLVLTLTEQQGIESVAVKVDGSTELVSGDGEPLTEPVTRPTKINADRF
ncbi:GerMN domain-containing protein [Bacillus chungangensis]|uniref:Germination protein M n=1 Tax=Bacillus chungangensis TaxID=587633 RepID=A0ABT9WMT9_9BACI|nr:GerMN domain-containing protein [Bacillus chungangensis]MDQ0174468.1 germination protein M [Bacillus chungangensis]